jgi:uncharacterized protein (TIGR02284 family)
LNDLLVDCKASAEDYEQAAELAASGRLADFFRATADYRWQLADRLAAQVRDLGDLPREPDPDRQLLDHALTRLKAVLHLTGDRDLIGERREDDGELLEAARSTLELDLPDPARDAVRSLVDHVRESLEALHPA